MLVGPVLVQKLFADLFTKSHVVTATSPLPGVCSTGTIQSLTSALSQSSFTAVPGDGVGDSGGDDGVDVGGLPVVLLLLPDHVEGGHGTVPDLVFKLPRTLLHGKFSSRGDRTTEQEVSLVDMSGGQHGICQ